MGNKKHYPVLCPENLCTACGACENICPKGAVVLESDKYGFKYPKVNLTECVQCSACETVCPVLHPSSDENAVITPKVYACWNKDSLIRQYSSSGGAFSALAMSVLQRGGMVVGAAYNSDTTISHRIITSTDDLSLLRGSKYVQSNINLIFREIKQSLIQGNEVLFVGTPCQNAGLRSFLRKSYPKLICCDFICHGVPSQYLFQRYLHWIEIHKGYKINSFNFRSKRVGWYDANRVVNGNKTLKGKYDAYFYGFNRNITLRESCYHCPATGLPRKGDITIADFWGIGQKYKFPYEGEIHKGVSLVIVNNSKGASLLDRARTFMNCYPAAFDEALEHNQPMVKPAVRPKQRDTFYEDFISMDFDELQNKYLKVKGKAKVIACVREYSPRSMVVGMRKIIQYLIWKKHGSKTL